MWKTYVVIGVLILLVTGCASPVVIDHQLSDEELSKKLHHIVTKEKYDLNIVKKYVQAGADINYRSPYDQTSTFQYAIGYISEGGQHDVVKFMLENQADIHHRNKDGQTALHAAVAKNDPALVQMIIDAGAVLNPIDELGRTPVHEAVKDGTLYEGPTTLTTLIAAGANLNIRDRDGRTPIFRAATLISNHVNSLNVLIKAKAEINIADHNGDTPLHVAVTGRTWADETGLLLLNKGAKVNVQNKQGKTPLHFAIEFERTESVKMLLAAGADKKLKDAFGSTPLDVAKKINNQEIINILANK